MPAMSQMGIFEAMYSARAMRRFKTDPVPDATIREIVDAAIRATAIAVRLALR